MAFLKWFRVEVIVILFGALVHRTFVDDDVGYNGTRSFPIGIMARVLVVELLQELRIQLFLFMSAGFW